jgi:hypothetical protein
MKLSLVLLLTAACASKKDVAPVEGSAAPQTGRPMSAITLERTSCYGHCPVYTLAVSPEGKITYQGTANVKHVGSASGEVPATRVSALLDELDKAGYFSFADRYTPSEPSCGRYATDLPGAITSATLDGRTKRIEHDQGCGAAPEALVVLERRIDDVLGSSRWTGR